MRLSINFKNVIECFSEDDLPDDDDYSDHK